MAERFERLTGEDVKGARRLRWLLIALAAAAVLLALAGAGVL